MKCEKCERELAKNSVKNGVQYYYCTHCRKSYSIPKEKPDWLIYEIYIAQQLHNKCYSQINQFTKTKWNINQIARLLGHHYRDIDKWVNKENKVKECDIDKNKFQEYFRHRENYKDILCVLGYRTAENPSETILNIITRKKREIKSKEDNKFVLKEDEYLRLVTMPITSRKEAIFVLGALLGCKTSEIIGLKYSDIDYKKKLIKCRRIVTFGKEIKISEEAKQVSHRTYTLTQKMLNIIEWLRNDTKKNAEYFGSEFNNKYVEFLCIDEKGNFIKSYLLNVRTKEIRNKANIITQYEYGSEILDFQFRWLRCTVQKIMIKAGVCKSDIKSIFGYYSYLKPQIELLNTMRKAYDILDNYIDEKSINGNAN